MIVVVEGGDELVGLATMEPVPAVESPPEWPRRTRRAHVGLVLRGEVPLAHRVAGIAVGSEDLAQEPVLLGRPPPVPREADGEVRHPTHPVAVVVAPGEQAGPGGGAQRGGVEIGQPDPVSGQLVHHRGVDVRAVATELGEADVIEHHQDDVRGPGRRSGDRRPPRL
jgi:hypothetical protein